jgi:O-antigen polymerase
MITEYQKLYPRLQSSALFLYNYGAELNHVNRYCESLEILDKCRTRLNDYDLQLLFADNYLNTGDTLTALKSYELASNMIPCRFVPLFQKFQIFKEMKKNGEAAAVARQIVNKEIEIE